VEPTSLAVLPEPQIEQLSCDNDDRVIKRGREQSMCLPVPQPLGLSVALRRGSGPSVLTKQSIFCSFCPQTPSESSEMQSQQCPLRKNSHASSFSFLDLNALASGSNSSQFMHGEQLQVKQSDQIDSSIKQETISPQGKFERELIYDKKATESHD